MYGTGISKEGDLIDLASENGIVEKSGSWFAFKGERIGQGRENAKEYLREHPEALRDLESQVLAKFGVKAPEPEVAQPEPEDKRPRVVKARQVRGDRGYEPSTHWAKARRASSSMWVNDTTTFASRRPTT